MQMKSGRSMKKEI